MVNTETDCPIDSQAGDYHMTTLSPLPSTGINPGQTPSQPLALPRDRISYLSPSALLQPGFTEFLLKKRDEGFAYRIQIQLSTGSVEFALIPQAEDEDTVSPEDRKRDVHQPARVVITLCSASGTYPEFLKDWRGRITNWHVHGSWNVRGRSRQIAKFLRAQVPEVDFNRYAIAPAS